MATFQKAVAKNIVNLMDELPNTAIPHASQTTRIFQTKFRETADYKTVISGIIQILEDKGSFRNNMSGLGSLSQNLGHVYRKIQGNKEKIQILATDFKAKGYLVAIDKGETRAALHVFLPNQALELQDTQLMHPNVLNSANEPHLEHSVLIEMEPQIPQLQITQIQRQISNIDKEIEELSK